MVLKLIKLMSQAKLLRPERQVATSLSKASRNRGGASGSLIGTLRTFTPHHCEREKLVLGAS